MMKMFRLKKDYAGVILEKLVTDQLVKNFPAPYGNPKCITLFKRDHSRNQLHPVTIFIF
jgi:hypothetical protein